MGTREDEYDYLFKGMYLSVSTTDKVLIRKLNAPLMACLLITIPLRWQWEQPVFGVVNNSLLCEQWNSSGMKWILNFRN